MNRRAFLCGSGAALLVPLLPAPGRAGDIVGELSTATLDDLFLAFTTSQKQAVQLAFSVYISKDGEKWKRVTTKL